MISKSTEVRKHIDGLDELFAIVPEDHNFHDSEVESFEWRMMDNEVVLKISDTHINDKIYFITWHITPDPGGDIQFYGAPYNTYLLGIDITEVENHPELVRLQCDGNSGLVVNATSIRVTIEEIPKEDYKLWTL